MPPLSKQRRAIWGWSLYDFANSAFTTLIVTFVYATYFTEYIASDSVEGTRLWSLGVTITALVVAFLSPFLGALADRGGYRKRYLLIATVICIIGSVVLFFPLPGQVRFALTAFVIANIAFEMANVFYNAFLPDVAPPDEIGRVSGNGWALGYAGGLVCMIAGLVVLINPEIAPFGLDKATGGHVRATNLLVAVWFALFSIPMFLWVSDEPAREEGSAGTLIRSAARELKSTFHEIRRFREVFRLLLARLIYNDGLVTIFAFGGIYAAGTFGFTTNEIIQFGIALNVAAGLGAFAFGYLDDSSGARLTILVSLVGLTLAAILAVFAQTRLMFWIAGMLVGVLAGPNQSASRSLMGRFTPDDRESEFFGFYAFSGKATAFLGPLLLGQLTAMFGTQRAGVAIVILFFLVGGLLVLRINESAGILASGRPTAAKE